MKVVQMFLHYRWQTRILLRTKGGFPPFVLLFSLLSFLVKGQQISSETDSIHQLQGKEIEKLDQYETIFKNQERSDNFTQLGIDAHEIAKWLYSEKKYDKAIELTKKAIIARKKAIPYDETLLKKSFFNLGFFYQKNQNYSKSIKAYREMISYDGDEFLNGRAYSSIGEIYDILGDPYRAVQNHISAFQFYDPEQHQQNIIRNHIYLALAYRSHRKFKFSKLAIKHFKKADSLLQLSPRENNTYKYLTYNGLGGVFLESTIQNIPQSLSWFEKALSQAEKMNRESYLGRINYNLGLVYTEIDPETAVTFFQKSLQYPKNNEYLKPSIYMGLGTVAFENKKYDLSKDHFRKSLSLFFNTNVEDNSWTPSDKELINITNKSLLLEVLKRQIKNWLAIGQTGNNKNAYKNAIHSVKISDRLIDMILLEDISTDSKLLWRDLASEIYILGLEACHQTNSIEEAFYLMEKNKALLLTQDIVENHFDLPDYILENKMIIKNEILHLQKEYQKEATNKDSILELIIKKKTKLEKFQDSLSTKYPEYFSNSSLPKILPLSEIRLGDNQVILQYNMAERVAGVTPNAYGMFISNQKNQLFKITEVDTLLKNIKELRKKLNHPFTTRQDINDYHRVSYQLYNQLIPDSIQKELLDKKVTIITDHYLSFIPFDALTTSLDSSRYLIETCEISYTYSLSFQKENSSIKRNAARDFLGMAPVQFSNELSNLKKSEDEVLAANKYYTGALFTRAQATKENFLKEAKNFRILHLATHANASDTLDPWIALANGKLGILELNNLKTKAELVILSACNTSLGEVQRGEGVMSLARGFFRSGASSVIPSLWSTNDKATATITPDFYKNLSQGHTKSEALRTAKLNYLKNNSDAEASPHYWASLVLIGDSGPLLPKSNNTLLIFIVLSIFLISILGYLISRRKKK